MHHRIVLFAAALLVAAPLLAAPGGASAGGGGGAGGHASGGGSGGHGGGGGGARGGGGHGPSLAGRAAAATAHAAVAHATSPRASHLASVRHDASPEPTQTKILPRPKREPDYDWGANANREYATQCLPVSEAGNRAWFSCYGPAKFGARRAS